MGTKFLKAKLFIIFYKDKHKFEKYDFLVIKMRW